MLLSVVIPNYNGKKYLKKNLPYLIKELSNVNSEVIVVDDHSTDDSIEFINIKFKDIIKIIKRKKNGGFSKACNEGIRISLGEYILLINNDVRIDKPFITGLMKTFNENVFAVVPSIRLPGRKGAEEGFNVIDFTNGDLKIESPNIDGLKYIINEPIEISHAVAACALYKKEKLIEIGMFDEIFSPCFWEDVDLSFKAIKKGWKIIYDPRFAVYHEKSKTVKKYYKFNRRFMINLKNRLLCTWLHLDSEELLNRHFMYLVYLYETGRRTKNKNILIALRMAFDEIDNIKKKKKSIVQESSFSDLINKFNIKNYEKYLNNNSVL